MTTPAATPATSVRLVRYVVCAALAMALGLTCAVLAVALSSGMGGMGGMSGMSSASGMASVSGASGMAGMSEASTTAFAPRPWTGSATGASPADAGTDAAPLAAQATLQMTPMCHDMCAGVTATALCTAAAGFFLTGLAALLLASPRNNLLGLLARTSRSGASRPRRRQRTPWLTPTPVALCVFRV